jgi:hypothetical protein
MDGCPSATMTEKHRVESFSAIAVAAQPAGELRVNTGVDGVPSQAMTAWEQLGDFHAPGSA